MTEIRNRLIIIILYLLPFIVTVFSVMFQKTGILSGGPGSRICFIGELAALLFSGVFIFLREIKTESRPSIAAKTTIFCSVMLYLLFMSLLFLAGEAFVLLSEDIKLGDIFFKLNSPDGKIEAYYMNDGEYRTWCYAVHLQSWNPKVKSAFFHTRLPVSQKVSPRWDGNSHFIFESSDAGTIHFRYKNGQWTVEPEFLINKEPPKIPSGGKPDER